MLGLSPLGLLHTAISLVALAAGAAALLRDGRIASDNGLGRTYLWATVLTCLTGFGIFRHGGFGAPHALGVATLVVIALALWPAWGPWFVRRPSGAGIATVSLEGRWRYVATVGYSLTLFFHMIPGLTETFTRLPVGAPLFSGPDDPVLQKVVGVVFLVFLGGAGWQVYRLRTGDRVRPLVPLQRAGDGLR